MASLNLMEEASEDYTGSAHQLVSMRITLGRTRMTVTAKQREKQIRDVRC